MKIAFRADASLEIGTGHVMRCLTLAEALRDKGAKVVFVCRELPGNLCDLVSAKGFEVFRLTREHILTQKKDEFSNCGTMAGQTVHAHWLSVDQDTDSWQTMGVLATDSAWDWLIIDHYALDIQWESAMRKVTKNIMVIDDMANREHDCEILLDHNLFANTFNRYSRLVGSNTLQLLGPEYALLRKEFSDHRRSLTKNISDKKKILISFGGVDLLNAAGRVVSLLKNEIKMQMDITVVAGMANPNFECLMKTCDGSKNITLFRTVESIAQLLAGTYIAVGGGGVSALERCALGIPTLIYAIAENQIKPSMELSRIGAAVYMGKIEDMRPDAFIENIEMLVNDKGAWSKMSQEAMETVDAEGISRILSCIMEQKG